MECEDAFSDMGSLKQNLELPPEYVYDDGEPLGVQEHVAVCVLQVMCSFLQPCNDVVESFVCAHPTADDSDIDDAMMLGSTPTLGSTPKA